MARYLLAATPVPGHVAPMASIGAHLASRGHQVTMLTGPRFAARTQEAGMSFLPLPPAAVTGASPAAVPLDRRPLPGALRRWQRGRAEMRSLFVTPLAAQHQSLAAALAGTAADAVLVDIGFTGVLPLLLAGGPRPPVLVGNMCPLMLTSPGIAPFGMARQPRPGAASYQALTWLVHHVLFGDIQDRASRTLRDLAGAPLPVFLTDWPLLADRLLQFSVPALEYPRPALPGNVIFTGPVPPAVPPPAPLPDWWPEVTAARTVVHVTQGTWDNADLSRLAGPAMRGLDGSPALVVVSTGGRPLSELPQPLPANVRAAEFLPYDLLLPLTDVLVTNGGYGAVQQALAHGVPLVVAGDTADKPEVAARVDYNGCGIDLRTGTPSPRSVASAVAALLTDGGYRARAARLRKDIEATSALDTISDVLERL
jgi:UDP:flavonoid glycosyltransferase YjiC (YdhE family)